jgi:proton-coupled amino acid transporter
MSLQDVGETSPLLPTRTSQSSSTGGGGGGVSAGAGDPESTNNNNTTTRFIRRSSLSQLPPAKPVSSSKVTSTSSIKNRLSTQASQEELHAAPPKKATWITAGLLLVADIVGAGVMGLPAAFGQLGWVLSILSLVLWLLICLKVGVQLSEAVSIYPTSNTFGDLAHHTFGLTGKRIVAGVTYIYIAFVLGDYLLLIGQTLQMVFYDSKICTFYWSIIAAVLLLPMLQFRLLNATRYVLWLNTLAIIICLLVALIQFSVLGTGSMLTHTSLQATNNTCSNCSLVQVIPDNLTAYTFFSAQSMFAFAYVGVFIYVEIISEMENKDFDKALLGLAGPVTFTLYLVAGSWGYAYLGSLANGLFIENIPKGPTYRACAVLFLIHMLVTYLIKGNILNRAVHRYVHLETLNDWSMRGSAIFFGVSFVMLTITWLVANLVPFFDGLTSLLGAFFVPYLGFIVPFAFLLKARSDVEISTSKREIVFMVVVTIFQLLLWGIGTYASVVSIIDSWETLGLPFSCDA